MIGLARKLSTLVFDRSVTRYRSVSITYHALSSFFFCVLAGYLAPGAVSPCTSFPPTRQSSITTGTPDARNLSSIPMACSNRSALALAVAVVLALAVALVVAVAS